MWPTSRLREGKMPGVDKTVLAPHPGEWKDSKHVSRQAGDVADHLPPSVSARHLEHVYQSREGRFGERQT